MAGHELDDFEKLYREHVDGVLAYALARTTEALAIEVVESTFLVAWQRNGELPDSARAWLIGVARKVLADQRRADSRRQALGLRIMAMRADEYAGSDPAEEVTARDSALATLEQLPETDRELLRLIAWEGLSIAEAAAVLGCSKSALKVRLHRARRRFTAIADDEPSAVTDHAAIVRPFPTDQPLLAKETI